MDPRSALDRPPRARRRRRRRRWRARVDARRWRRDARTAQCDARACSSAQHTHSHARTMAILSLAVKLSGFGVGYVYPVYCSLKLLDRKSNTQDDYVLWLTYMIIAFTMVIAESWGIVLWYVVCVLWCAVSCSGDGWRATRRGARESCQSARRRGSDVWGRSSARNRGYSQVSRLKTRAIVVVSLIFARTRSACS